MKVQNSSKQWEPARPKTRICLKLGWNFKHKTKLQKAKKTYAVGEEKVIHTYRVPIKCQEIFYVTNCFSEPLPGKSPFTIQSTDALGGKQFH